MPPNGLAEKALIFLASTELAIWLFGALSLLAIPGTFTESRTIYHSPPFVGLIALFALNLSCCTIKRWRALAKSTVILHGGVLLTLAGCVMTSFGYVATVNVYEGTSVSEVFRWDKNADTPLGMQLEVKQIHREFYPVPVRVGVMKGSEKYRLFTLKTGEKFEVPGYQVVASTFDPKTTELSLNVYQGGSMIGVVDTSGKSTLPVGFPYVFKLVSYKDPFLKRIWIDLVLARDGKTLGSGTAEINGPFTWEGLYFYNTQIASDKDGRSFAGIQIVKDPGRPVVFSGFAIMCLGAVLAFYRRFYGRNKGVYS